MNSKSKPRFLSVIQKEKRPDTGTLVFILKDSRTLIELDLLVQLMACSKTVIQRNLRIALSLAQTLCQVLKNENSITTLCVTTATHPFVNSFNQPILSEFLKIKCAFNFLEPCTLSGLLNLFKKVTYLKSNNDGTIVN